VTETAAAVWTDGRYYLQAEQQLFEGFCLMKDGLDSTPSINEWLKEVRAPAVGADECSRSLQQVNGGKIGVDMQSIDISTTLSILLADVDRSLMPPDSALRFFAGLDYEGCENLVDLVWGDERPDVPIGPAVVHPLEVRALGWRGELSCSHADEVHRL
jgi:Xaa-Pro aminopeptidase